METRAVGSYEFNAFNEQKRVFIFSKKNFFNSLQIKLGSSQVAQIMLNFSRKIRSVATPRQEYNMREENRKGGKRERK